MTVDVVDVHAHFLTDEYVAAARRAGHHRPDGMPRWPTWDERSQLDLMDRCGIGRSLLSVSSPGVHFGDDRLAGRLARAVNEAAAGIVERHPDRFGFLASLPAPDVDACLAEGDHAFDELGAQGVILLTTADGCPLADPRMEPVLAALDARSAVVLLHPTAGAAPPTDARVPPPVVDFLFDTTTTVIDLLAGGALTRYPRLRLVVPHGGAALPLVVPRLRAFAGRLGDQLPQTWAEPLRRLWFDTAGTPFPVQVPALLQITRPDRVVYGSDSCWTPVDGVAEQLRSLDDAQPPPGTSSWRVLTSRNASILLAGGS